MAQNYSSFKPIDGQVDSLAALKHVFVKTKVKTSGAPFASAIVQRNLNEKVSDEIYQSRVQSIHKIRELQSRSKTKREKQFRLTSIAVEEQFGRFQEDVKSQAGKQLVDSFQESMSLLTPENVNGKSIKALKKQAQGLKDIADTLPAGAEKQALLKMFSGAMKTLDSPSLKRTMGLTGTLGNKFRGAAASAGASVVSGFFGDSRLGQAASGAVLGLFKRKSNEAKHIAERSKLASLDYRNTNLNTATGVAPVAGGSRANNMGPASAAQPAGVAASAITPNAATSVLNMFTSGKGRGGMSGAAVVAIERQTAILSKLSSSVVNYIDEQMGDVDKQDNQKWKDDVLEEITEIKQALLGEHGEKRKAGHGTQEGDAAEKDKKGGFSMGGLLATLAGGGGALALLRSMFKGDKAGGAPEEVKPGAEPRASEPATATPKEIPPEEEGGFFKGAKKLFRKGVTATKDFASGVANAAKGQTAGTGTGPFRVDTKLESMVRGAGKMARGAVSSVGRAADSVVSGASSVIEKGVGAAKDVANLTEEKAIKMLDKFKNPLKAAAKSKNFGALANLMKDLGPVLKLFGPVLKHLPVVGAFASLYEASQEAIATGDWKTVPGDFLTSVATLGIPELVDWVNGKLGNDTEYSKQIHSAVRGAQKKATEVASSIGANSYDPNAGSKKSPAAGASQVAKKGMVSTQPDVSLSTKPTGGDIVDVSARYESGGKGAGAISNGKGDKGGKSYGTYQLASNTGTLQEFLKSSPYGKAFAGLKPGSKEFDVKWKELAATDPGFAAAQKEFIKQTHYDKAISLLKKNGIDLSKQGKSVQSAVWSTAVQFGPAGASKLIRQALDGKGSGDAVSITNAIQDYKIKNNDKLFGKSSSNVRQGTLKRAISEKRDYMTMNENGVLPTKSKSPIQLASAGQTNAALSSQAQKASLTASKTPVIVPMPSGGSGGGSQQNASPMQSGVVIARLEGEPTYKELSRKTMMNAYT